MLRFFNPGEIDPIAMTTLGVNVKEGESPIGFFGTGLKYTIAASLRLGFPLTICSGLRTFTFQAKPTTIRGKEFDLIWLCGCGEPYPLGFTTALGKTWEPWMLYRELFCNAKDEGGDVEVCPNWQAPVNSPGVTSIYVSGLDGIHDSRDDFILQGTPLFANKGLEIHAAPSSALFYRGIKVGNLPPCVYTYNMIDALPLTEDRTTKDIYGAKLKIAKNMVGLISDEDAWRKILLSDLGEFEEGMDFDWEDEPVTPAFLDAAEWALVHRPGSMNASAKTVLLRLRPIKREKEEVSLNRIEEAQLAKAKTFLAKLGHEITYPIVVVKTLGNSIFGHAKNGTIWLAKDTFGMGTKFLTSTILEEQLHLEQGFLDCSRELQNWLFNRVISLGEELAGEPL